MSDLITAGITEIVTGITELGTIDSQRPIVGIGQRNATQEELAFRHMDYVSERMRVHMPAVVVSFNPETQTVTVQPLIRDRVIDPVTGNPNWLDLPLISDVPVQFPRGGNFIFTFPIQPGDEVMLAFQDRCFDAWFANGGPQNWNDLRSHHLSDAVAIPGVYSQPNVVPGFYAGGTQLRQIDGTAAITVDNMTLVSNDIPRVWDHSKMEANGASVECTMTNVTIDVDGVPVDVPTPTVKFTGLVVGI